MKPIVITLVLMSFLRTASAQTNGTSSGADRHNQSDTLTTAQPTFIFTAVEQEPMPAGGMGVFYAFLQANTKYPNNAAKNRIEGKVFVTFVVEKDGSLNDIKILRGVSPDIDAEALRVFGIAPKWRPGIQNGRPVRVQYSMAINFKLPNEQPVILTNAGSVSPMKFDSSDTAKVYTTVEHEPVPQGGMQGFYQYLANATHYPEQAKKKNIQGKVFLMFVVEKDGSLSNVKVLRGVSKDIDAEAIRVISTSPKWSPGLLGGKAVRVQYVVPLSFTLHTK